MAVQTHKKTLGGLDFELTELPAFEGLDAFQRFLGIISPSLPALSKGFSAFRSKKPGEALSPEARAALIDAIAVALPEVLMRCRPGELSELSRIVLGPCLVQTKGPKKQLAKLLDIVDELLRGKLDVLLQLLVWGVQVQFRSFSSLLGSVGGVLGEAVQESPSTSHPS
jgi:hypothetical protein